MQIETVAACTELFQEPAAHRLFLLDRAYCNLIPPRLDPGIYAHNFVNFSLVAFQNLSAIEWRPENALDAPFKAHAHAIQ